MKPLRWHKVLSLTVCFSLGGVLFFAPRLSASEIPRAELPAVITSLGQSPDAYVASVLARRAKVKIHYENLLSPESVSKYRTLLMAVGASLKGFGSAGVNLDTELKRGKKIVKAAKENNVFLIILHTGGEGRREQMSNKLLGRVAGQAQYLLVLKDGNKDEYFTKLSKDKKIPLKLVDSVLEVQDIFKQLFKGE